MNYSDIVPVDLDLRIFHDVAIQVFNGITETTCAKQDGILEAGKTQDYPCIQGARVMGGYNGYYLRGVGLKIRLTKHIDGIPNQLAISDLKVLGFDEIQYKKIT